jgi:hypothetical protein
MQSLLQPEDSKRVADAIIEKIEFANLDLGGALKEILHDEFPLTADSLAYSIPQAIRRAIANHFEDQRVDVDAAIRDGVRAGIVARGDSQ